MNIAFRFLERAHSTSDLSEQMLYLTVALECLVAPHRGEGPSTVAISKRTRTILKTMPNEAVQRLPRHEPPSFGKIKEFYKLRSRFVHGTAGHDEEPSDVDVASWSLCVRYCIAWFANWLDSLHRQGITTTRGALLEYVDLLGGNDELCQTGTQSIEAHRVRANDLETLLSTPEPVPWGEDLFQVT